MTAANMRQFDLFAPGSGSEPVSAGPGAKRAPRNGLRPVVPQEPEAMARQLEETGAYRVLRRLEARPVLAGWSPDRLAPGEKIGVILDTETTGLDCRSAEIIELGMVMFTYDDAGIRDVVRVFDALREPGVAIPPEITRITGITDEMVAGKAIAPAAVADFIAPADLVVAHNAKFDRPFCERFAPGFDAKAWACSVAEVDWTSLGFEGSKLTYLIGQCGWFHNGHRAVDDCHALLEVLDFRRDEAGPSAFAGLVASAGRRRGRVFAVGSPFELKDALKARGYRWNDGNDGRPKSWWTEIEEDGFDAECRFLRKEIYRRDVEPIVQWLTAVERYRA